jgi:peptidoglycan-associated lipoprotein
MRQTRQLLLWVGAAASLVLFTGCPPTYPKCDSDEHCKDKGEVCVQGQCQECATDVNCKEGFVCDGNRCVPKPVAVKPECQQDGDCAGGAKCQNNRCVARAGACSTDADCPGGQVCENGTCAAKTSTCSYDPIRFEFNESKLTSEAQNQLAQLADCIKKEKARLTLEGHADERGTEEFNLQLSNRRAASVKRYLVDLGVSNGSLDTVGFGENRPAEQGSTESAWSANRRVEMTKK